MTEHKKKIFKLIVNVVVAAISAIATALGVTSCMGVSSVL